MYNITIVKNKKLATQNFLFNMVAYKDFSFYGKYAYIWFYEI
jgi:hypothetical protein